MMSYRNFVFALLLALPTARATAQSPDSRAEAASVAQRLQKLVPAWKALPAKMAGLPEAKQARLAAVGERLGKDFPMAVHGPKTFEFLRDAMAAQLDVDARARAILAAPELPVASKAAIPAGILALMDARRDLVKAAHDLYATVTEVVAEGSATPPNSGDGASSPSLLDRARTLEQTWSKDVPAWFAAQTTERKREFGAALAEMMLIHPGGGTKRQTIDATNALFALLETIDREAAAACPGKDDPAFFTTHPELGNAAKAFGEAGTIARRAASAVHGMTHFLSAGKEH